MLRGLWIYGPLVYVAVTLFRKTGQSVTTLKSTSSKTFSRLLNLLENCYTKFDFFDVFGRYTQIVRHTL